MRNKIVLMDNESIFSFILIHFSKLTAHAFFILLYFFFFLSMKCKNLSSTFSPGNTEKLLLPMPKRKSILIHLKRGTQQ